MEADTTPTAKFVSQKVNKIRWQPVSKRVTLDSSVFATGSWDDEVNRVSLWSTTTATDDEYTEGSPTLLCSIEHPGDVTDLNYVNFKQILATSSLGSVHLYKHHDTSSQSLGVSHRWERVHEYPGGAACACTALATRGGDDAFATVGEDGKLAVFAMDSTKPMRVIKKADSCTLNDVIFLKHNEVAAVNSTGQLKVWDLRQSSDAPANILLLTGERQSLQCVDKHPTQPHIVVTGGEDGSLCIWDMRRQGQHPVTLLNAHDADMWEVRFHPTSPDNLFTCSQDGSVWHWDSCSMNSNNSAKEVSASRMSMSLTAPTTPAASASSGWLASEAAKHRMDITNLLPSNAMPINSIDIVANTLLCATDGEQIITVPHLAIK